MNAFQAIVRKGKPNWFHFFALWFSFKVTTNAVQTSLWHVYSLFTAPLNTFYFGFLGWLELCFSLGMHVIDLFQDCPSVCLTLFQPPAATTPQGAAAYLAKHHLCNKLPVWGVFLKANWDLRFAENTELLCHDTTMSTSSARFPWALQLVKGGEVEIFCLSFQQPCAFFKATPITQLAFSFQQWLCKQPTQAGWRRSHSRVVCYY